MKKILFLLLVVIASSCSDDDEELQPKSTEKQILEFSIDGNEATIDQTNKTLTVELPYGSDLSALKPIIVVSDKASVDPASDAVQDFDNPVEYTVTAEDGSKQAYTVSVIRGKSSDNNILSFYIRINDRNIRASIDHQTQIISMVVPSGTDITKLSPIIAISHGASLEPASGTEQDFTDPVVYTVTAHDGSKLEYVVDIKDEVANAAPRLVSTMIDRESGVKPYHRFYHDYSGKLIRYVETEPEFLEELVDRDVIEIAYDDQGKITTITKTEKEKSANETTHVLNVVYQDEKTIHVSNESATTSDIITLDDKGYVTEFRKGEEDIQKFEYDAAGNLIKLTDADGSYQTVAYDDKNGLFRHDKTAQWIWLYVTGDLIGKGANNFTSTQTYNSSGELIETTNYRYVFDPSAWYPNAYRKENHTRWMCIFY